MPSLPLSKRSEKGLQYYMHFPVVSKAYKHDTLHSEVKCLSSSKIKPFGVVDTENGPFWLLSKHTEPSISKECFPVFSMSPGHQIRVCNWKFFLLMSLN